MSIEKKVITIGGALLIGITICVSTWLYLRAQAARRGQPFASNGAGTVQPSQTDTVSDDQRTLTEKERAIQRAKSRLMSNLSEAQLARPSNQKFFEIMDSPEFRELLGTGFTHKKWNDFMELRGIPVVRKHTGLFHRFVPDIALADYEPVVRLKLAELFLTAEPVDLTDPRAAARQRSDIYLELGEAGIAAAAWFIETFGEDRDGAFEWKGVENNAAFIWMTDIQQNAASIVAAAREVEDAHFDKIDASAPAWDMSSVSHSETEIPTTLDAEERATMTDTEIERLLTPQPPDTPTNERPDPPGEIQTDLEKNLRAQFSSERFEKAMSTLERYGQEEGLRRLRANDPEIAQQVQRHRTRKENSR